MGQLIRITKAEFLRLMKNKATYIVMLVHIISIALLYVEYIHKQVALWLNGGMGHVASSTNEYVYRPFVIGTLTGSIVWGIYVLISASKVKKNGSKEMVAAFMDERKHSFTRVMAFILVMIIDTCLCMLVFLPVSMQKMDYLFNLKTYITYPLILMLPGLIMTVFLMEALYRFFENIGVALFIFALLTGSQFTTLFFQNPFVSWNFPQEYWVSDTVGGAGTIRMQIYTRIILVLVAVGVWGISVLFTRKYQFGPIRSFIVNLRKPLRLTVPVITILIAVTMLVKQPFIDHGPLVVEDMTYEVCGDELFVICNNIEKDFYFDTTLGKVRGIYKLDIENNEKEELEIAHNAGLKIKKLTFNGKDVDFTSEFNEEDTLYTVQSLKFAKFKLPEGSKGELVCEFEGYPTQSRTYYKMRGYDCSFNSIGRDYIYAQCDIVDMNDAMADPECIKTYVNVPADHIPLMDGYEMEKEQDNDDGTARWEYEGDAYSVMSAVNKVVDIDYDKADVKLEYNQKNEPAVRKNNMDEAVADVLQFCEDHIGPLETDEYNRVSIEFVSSELGGGTAGFGNVVIDESLFSADKLNDSKDGSNANEVFMHEIVHLYHGDLGLLYEDDGLWSCEGMTVYTTYRIVKEKYGELYANKYYVDSWKESVKRQNNNFYLRHPEYMDKLPESYRTQILNSIVTENKYCRMPLMLLKAEEILGEERMDEVIQELYSHKEEYRENFSGCTFQEFLDIAGLSEEDLELE